MSNKYTKKVCEHLVSWKFQLLVLGTYLFMKGTLSENGWLMVAASTTGLRELVNLTTLKLGAQDKKEKVDNPDVDES